ncbi:phage tail protein [Serratia odorifera]|uniref:Phage minor tail protein n=2 Tax=Serratia odorifera TaxID=618 RepID=D4E896_SEROD|nr:phage tail protein [Serratia odorifera]EFE93949.1 phage minor tail protein [Serratia odorifera DSM 4582]PNK88852.1 phage tail protein [Serratia odorifera]RII69799.1 phage tail protein [Serratia odorifera]VDZ64758.1 Phage-related protein [Serratia odorifera]
MKLETFDFPARVGTAGDIEPQVRSTPFGDGYVQSTGDGINSEKESWPLSFVGPWEEIQPIIAFLRSHKGYRSFKWRNPIFELGLYQAGKLTITASGAYFSLSVTFTRAYHP